MTNMLALMEAVDYAGIKSALMADSALANRGIVLKEGDTRAAHPLHRLCDGVFEKKYTDEQAVDMAKIFIEYGAHVDGDAFVLMQDTPLIAASSLYSDKTALLYIDQGAVISHAGCHGGTALHWAAWCGRDIVLKRLIEEGAEINRICIDFKSTPLFWAIHGMKFGGIGNQHNQLECARLLLKAGANKNIPNAGGTHIVDMLSDDDNEARELLK